MILSCPVMWKHIGVFHFSRIFIPILPLATKVFKLKCGVKNKVVIFLPSWGLKDAPWWEHSKSGLRIDIRWHLPLFLAKKKTVENWQNTLFCRVSTVFGPKIGSNVDRFKFWDQIRNPLIKAHLSDPKINPRQWSNGGCTPWVFLMAAEPRGGPRWNFA